MMYFADWQATRAHVADIGAAIAAPQLAGRSGFVYAGCLCIEDRCQQAKDTLAAECDLTVRIGGAERIGQARDLPQLEMELYRFAASLDCDFSRMPTVQEEAPQPQTERVCPECAELIKAAAKRCRWCGSRVRPLTRPVAA